MSFRAIVVAHPLTLTACVNPLAIDPARAESDARRALAQGDHRLVGVYGFASQTPGAAYEDRQRFGARFIQGAGDDLHYPGEVEYNARAIAARYNVAIRAAND